MRYIKIRHLEKYVNNRQLHVHLDDTYLLILSDNNLIELDVFE